MADVRGYTNVASYSPENPAPRRRAGHAHPDSDKTGFPPPQAVVRSPADGYTLLLVTTTNAINATFSNNLDFNLIHDVVPVGGLILVPNLMVVNPSVPAMTVPEFIAYAKANLGKMNVASTGNGTVPHMSGALFNTMAGVDIVHVQYRGAPQALTDLPAGQVQVYFASTTVSIEHIRTGKLRVLAVTTTKRSESLQDIPTLADFLPGYESSLWFGVGAPKNTPDSARAR